jgi:hypothetical protein
MIRQKYSTISKMFLAIAAVSALGACRTVITTYVPPANGETAKLLIRPTISPGMNYGIFAFEDAHSCRTLQKIATGNANTSNQSSVLHAGSLATLEYVGADRSRSCTISFSFYPKPRHVYLLAARQDSVNCSIKLLDATDGDSPREEKSFVRRVLTRNGCEPMSSIRKSGLPITETYRGESKPGEEGPGSSADRLNDLKDLLPTR